MPMYWTFNCFLGCIYTVYYIVFLVLNWLSNLEFWLPKKKGPSCPNWGHGGWGGLGNSGNARKKMFFFRWPLPLGARAPCIITWKLVEIDQHCHNHSGRTQDLIGSANKRSTPDISFSQQHRWFSETLTKPDSDQTRDERPILKAFPNTHCWKKFWK